MSGVASVLQALLILAGAPLVRGIIAAAKAHLQGRRGAPIWRPYTDLAKLFRKEDLVPPAASVIFWLAPRIVFAVTTVVAFMVPVMHPASVVGGTGGVILLVYLLALARFFLVLGGIDGGGAFGGMGGSREMLVSVLAEAPFVLALAAVAIVARTTDLSGIVQWTLGQNFFDISAVHILSLSALAMVAIAETGRMPVDNPTTHLELTMIHEAMVLEYSGPSLAFLEWASAIKLTAVFSLLVSVFFPWGMAASATLVPLALALAVYAGKMLAVAVTLSFVESSMAKMRMYAVPDFLGVAAGTSVLAVVFTVFSR